MSQVTGGAIWDVQPGVGSDTNGGCFDPTVSSPGTDYSTQSTPALTITDLLCVTSTTFSSALTPFTSAHVGNGIQISSGTGFTTGFVIITAVNAGVATFSSAMATAGNSGGHAKVGGTLNTLSICLSYATYNPQPVNANGNIIYLKGTLTVTATLNTNTTVTFELRGYTTTHGDGGQATWTTTTNSTNLFLWLNGGGAFTFRNIIFSNTATTRSTCFSTSSSGQGLLAFVNCNFSGFTNLIGGSGTGTPINCLMCHNCQFSAFTSDIFTAYCGTLMLYGCLLTGGSGWGINQPAGNTILSIHLRNTVIYNCTSGGIKISDANTWSQVTALHIINCVIEDCGSDGIHLGGGGTANPTYLYLLNTIIENNSGYGVNARNLASYYFGGYNAYYNNTNGAYNTTYYPGFSTDITLTATAINNASGGDFTLNNTSGGGAACKAVGFESTLF